MPTELEVIDSLISTAGSERKGYSRIGDDVGVMPSRPGKLLVKVDMLVEGTDVPTGMTYRQAARKAVAMCVSDFAAKGARPDSFLISLGLKRGVTDSQVKELGLGLRDAVKEWGVFLAGGDTNEAKELVIDCAMFGFSDRTVLRRGAKAGDALVVTERFGLQPAGLMILDGKARAEVRFGERARKSVLLPNPKLEVGIALAKHLSSAMDSSDGLARSLHTLAEASAVGFTLDSLPAAPGVEKFAKQNGVGLDQLVLAGGEEYVVVGTVPRRRLKSATKAAREAGGELIVIGEATSKKGKVELRTRGRLRGIPDVGWTHLG
ncbi:MAG TPA: thiamine-phosphate kinase [Nitrososphaerales archaeon]|nr:thiamine-phosphate kinase [Nitrososphaerales archaeon]